MRRSRLGGLLEWIFAKRSGAALYVVKTTTLSLVVAYLVTVPVALVQYAVGQPTAAIPRPEFFLVLVVAPLVENIVFIGMIEFMMAFDARRMTMVFVVAIVSGVVHGIVADWRAISGFIGFAVMSYSYLDWYASGFARRYFITVAQHALFNGSTVLLLMFVT